MIVDVSVVGDRFTAIGIPDSEDLPFYRSASWTREGNVRDLLLLRHHFPDAKIEMKSATPSPRELAEWPTPKLFGLVTLLPHQRAALEMDAGSFIIADDRGTGKTIQALAYIKFYGLQAVIVTRASAVDQWRSEADRMGIPSTDLEGIGKTGFSIPDNSNVEFPRGSFVLVVHYEELPGLAEGGPLPGTQLDAVVLDESHAIKEENSARTKLVLQLFSKIPHRICLSGTAARNRTYELWTQLAFVDPERFADRAFFLTRYCGGIVVPHGKNRAHIEATGTTNAEELFLRLKPIWLRRTKAEVAPELPPRTRAVEPTGMTLEERKSYEILRSRFLEYLRHTDPARHKRARRAPGLTKTNALNEFISKTKIPYAIEWVTEHPGALVFTQHRAVAKAIAKGTDSLLVTGDVVPEKRPAILAEFAKGGRSMVLTFGTGGEGLNLQSANEALIVDLPWVPGSLQQAEDRIHRIGQDRPVEITYFVTKGTADEKVLALLAEKVDSSPFINAEDLVAEVFRK